MKMTNTSLVRPTLVGLVLALAVSLLSSFVAQAVPYASGITRNGDTVSFILNHDAQGLTVLRDGIPLTPAIPATAGEHSFDMAGFTAYSIIVTGNTATAWVQFPQGDGNDRNFEYPYSVSINKNPKSANFGKVYISNGRANPTANGRAMSDGIYMLRADGADAGFSNGGQSWSGSSSPWKTMIGQDDHLYVSDLANDLAYEFNDDMSVATQLIDADNKTSLQYVDSIWVEGTKAQGNRKIYLVNGNYDDTSRKGLIMYDLGANDTAIGLGTGTQIIGPTCWHTYYPYDVTRDSLGNWYLITYRANPSQAPAITKFDGAGTIPLDDDIIWETGDWTTYYYSHGMDINESAGRVAYAQKNTGFVNMYDLANGTNVVERFDTGSNCNELAYDAAGNIVTVDNIDEHARFWSPGGYTVAITAFDGAQTSFQLVRPDTQVSVAASQATVPEAGPSVNFIISRVGSTASALTVYYTLSGTASNGVDYSTLTSSAVIPAAASSVNVVVSPNQDTIAELSETVILSLSTDPSYSVVQPNSATVSILDDENPEISFAAAAPKKLLEGYAPSRVTHQVVRKGLLTPALTVNLAYPGTATQGADFNAPTTVSLATGAANANLVLTPINDQAYEGDETATASIAAGTGYDIGTASSISATVVNDDPPPGTVLFSDNFDTDTSALWKVNVYDPSDAFVDFAWDYSAVGIPAAPAGGDTKGLRMRCGNALAASALDGLSVSPLGKGFTGDYRLKFDMWINYNGPMPDGGPGSTQNLDAGVGTSGDVAVWAYGFDAEAVWFSVTGDGAEYHSATHSPGGDYNAVIGAVVQNDDTGFYAAGTGAPDSGVRDASHPFYSLWGGHTAPAAQLALYPNQTGTAYLGNAGMAWHTVVITKAANVVTWVIDGITIATVTNTLPVSTNVFVGYQDLFSGTLSDVPDMSFGLVDNLKVMTLSAPTQPVITGIQLINGGTQVQISFTAGTGDSTSDFALQTTANLGAAPADIAATISSAGPGQFQAVRAVGGSAQFYRIRRN